MEVLISVLVVSVAIFCTAEKAIGVHHTVQGWDQVTAVNDSRSKMMFSVGDGLVFKMGDGEADIARVSKSDYEICSAEAPRAIYKPSTMEAICLNKTGNWYFISKVPDHCKSGKKLMIIVVSIATNNGSNKAGFRFPKAFGRMGLSHKGGGSGSGSGSGSGGGGGTPANGTPVNSNPLGNRNRVPPKKNGSSSTRELSAMVFKFQLATAVFCSVLLASPGFV